MEILSLLLCQFTSVYVTFCVNIYVNTVQSDVGVDPRSRLKLICTFQVESNHFSLAQWLRTPVDVPVARMLQIPADIFY